MNSNSATLRKTVWQIDPDHSKIGFSISHMLVSQISGYFREIKGSIIMLGDDFVNSEAEIVLQTASIDTNHVSRDKHLQSEEFLDSEKFPQIRFRSIQIEKLSENHYKVAGNLALHGIEKEVVFEMTYNGKVIDQKGTNRAGIKITGKVNRHDFGINWDAHLDNGGLVAGEIIELEGHAELISG